jgi:hypothetical protein
VTTSQVTQCHWSDLPACRNSAPNADYGRGATVSAVFVFRERIVRLCARHRWTGNLQQRHEQKLPARDESVRLQRGDLLLPAADA